MNNIIDAMTEPQAPHQQTPQPRTVCSRGHDLSVPGSTKLVRKDANSPFYRSCIQCITDKNIRKRLMAREQRRERKLIALEEEAGPEAQTNKMDMSPYGVTMRMLEKTWGVPSSRWTRQQHVEHTRAIYRAMGWPENKLPEETR